MRRPPLSDDVRTPPAKKPRARYCQGKPPTLHEYEWRRAGMGAFHDVWEERCCRCGRRDRQCFGPSQWFPGNVKCICGRHKEGK